MEASFDSLEFQYSDPSYLLPDDPEIQYSTESTPRARFVENMKLFPFASQRLLQRVSGISTGMASRLWNEKDPPLHVSKGAKKIIQTKEQMDELKKKLSAASQIRQSLGADKVRAAVHAVTGRLPKNNSFVSRLAKSDRKLMYVKPKTLERERSHSGSSNTADFHATVLKEIPNIKDIPAELHANSDEMKKKIAMRPKRSWLCERISWDQTKSLKLLLTMNLLGISPYLSRRPL